MTAGIVASVLAVAVALTIGSARVVFEALGAMRETNAVLLSFAIGALGLSAFAFRRCWTLKNEAARRQSSEARLAALFAASPNPIGLFSLDDGRVLDANETALRAGGTRREDMIGRNLVGLPFWDPAAAADLLQRIRTHGSVRNLEITTRTGAGEPRPVLVSAQTVVVEGERCFVAAMSDITEQRNAERARAASDAELQTVFSAMRDIVLVLSRNGEYLRIPATRADHPYRPSAELVGKCVHEVLPRAEADDVVSVIHEALEHGRAVTEYALHLDTGSVWFSAVVTPLDANSVVWVARDATEERAAGKALAESEAHYRLLFDRNPQPMFVLDEGDSRYLDVNEAALRHYGYTRDEFLAMTALDIRPPENVADYLAAEVGPWPVPESRVFRHRKRNGEVIDVEITRDSITHQGRPARLVMATDVTKRLAVSRELERSLSLQRATLEATADGILVVDREGRTTTWNGKFTEMWGLPSGLAEASRVEHAFAEALATVKDSAAVAATAASALASPHRATFDVLEFEDGRVVERYSQPQRIAGDGAGRVWSFRDVTQRERAIAQRKMLTDRFEGAFGDAPIGMMITAADGRCLEVNAAMSELVGRDEDELIGETATPIIHPDDRESTRAEIEKLRAGERRTVHFETRYRHSSGRDVWTLVHATRLSGDGDNAGLIISQVLDITKRRAAEESLRRQALVFGTISEAVVIVDADGRIAESNPAASAIFGYTREELLGQRPSVWMRSDGEPSAYETIGQALRETGRWSGEYGFVAKDGRTGIVESAVKVLQDAGGRALSTVGVMRDVTDRRELERHLLQAQKLEAIGSLAAGIAHEINTPTQYVGDNVCFLEEGIGALGTVARQARSLAAAAVSVPELHASAERLDALMLELDVDYLLSELPVAAVHSREGCERIADIVQAMKGFSHPGGTTKQLIDLNTVVRNTLTVCRSEWKYVATMVTNFDTAMPLVPCLPGEFQQVVLNLIVNAAHAIATAREESHELGEIVVSTRVTGDWAEILVQDDGCGIPEAIRAKVFDPFFTTKRVGMGTGQGLSISHATIVRKHQGTLTFETQEGRGTTFIIRLPLATPIDVSEAA